MLTDILQPTHLLVVLLVALLVLGPKRLPSAGRALGQGLREFKASITGESTNSEAEERPAMMPADPADAPTAVAAPEREPAQIGSSGAARSRLQEPDVAKVFLPIGRDDRGGSGPRAAVCQPAAQQKS